MIDRRQNVPRSQLYVTCHVHSAEDKEFGFWGAWELQGQACTQEDFEACTPRLWEKNTDHKSSPLLANDHHYSDLSPTSRRHVIFEGRKKLMQAIQNIPESCYELSLKDIVDEEYDSQKARGEDSHVDKKSFQFNTDQAQVRKQKKKIAYKTRQISRISSMESETFLIKMFFPNFLGSKKKPKAAGRYSKVSPRPPCEGNETQKGGCVESTNSSRRVSDDDTLPGCCVFFQSKKGISKRKGEAHCES